MQKKGLPSYAGQTKLKTKENDMLILTRRLGEKIIIGDNVKMVILGVKGNQVRIGIDAPKEISVHREEIQKRIDIGLKPKGGARDACYNI